MDFTAIKKQQGVWGPARNLWMKRGKKGRRTAGVDSPLWEEPEQAGFDPARGTRYQPLPTACAGSAETSAGGKKRTRS